MSLGQFLLKQLFQKPVSLVSHICDTGLLWVKNDNKKKKKHNKIVLLASSK